MRKLLIPLLAAIALPTAVNAEEFTEIKPKNIYSYKKSSLVKWEKDGRRFINFLGTSLFNPCFDNGYSCHLGRLKNVSKNHYNYSIQNLLWKYEIDCKEGTFNRVKDKAKWNLLWIDPTAKEVANKYCPIEEWSKLPNK